MADNAVPQQTVSTIPPVYGLTASEAIETLTRAGFQPVASSRRLAEAGTDFTVDRTLPPEGTAAFPGSRIDLLAPRSAPADAFEEPGPIEVAISQGTMPDFTGFLPEKAILSLEAAGFRAWPRDAWSEDDQGYIVATDPRPHTPLNVQVVTLWVAVAPPPDRRRPDPLPEPIIKKPLTPNEPVIKEEEEED